MTRLDSFYEPDPKDIRPEAPLPRTQADEIAETLGELVATSDIWLTFTQPGYESEVLKMQSEARSALEDDLEDNLRRIIE